MRTKICSTWNILKTKFFKSFLCFMSAFSVLFGCFSVSAFAGAVSVPVSAELIGELLVALGLMAGNATDGYTWVSKDNPYVDSVFEQQVKTITSGVPVSSETLGGLKGTVIPDNTYTYDGTNFYVGDKVVSGFDVFLTAKSLIGVSFSMPTNVSGGLSSSFIDGRGYCEFPKSYFGTDTFFFPYFITDSGSFVFSGSIYWNNKEGSNITVFDFLNYESRSEFIQTPLYDYLTYYWYYEGGYGQSPSIGGSAYSYVSSTPKSSELVRVSGIGDFDYNKVTSTSLLRTSGFPSLVVSGDSSSLGDAIVQVKPSDDDDNNGSTPPVPQSPNGWEIWQSFNDLIRQIDTGEVTNGGTSFQRYVNNNYNYVDVDINVPDTIHNDVSLSGGLDINGQGNINVTVHEDISLPSAGDGSGFYNPDATNVIGALVKDNPIIPVVSSLFSALDPTLVSVFSVSVSLLLIIGLWKLIKG